ncbi:hypothetical protein [Aeromonas veronii]|nr:hypothetical protein [Aeromonas veronii]UBR47635.1 hypothetical protein LAG74_09920 [Aeromonas veronii]
MTFDYWEPTGGMGHQQSRGDLHIAWMVCHRSYS